MPLNKETKLNPSLLTSIVYHAEEMKLYNLQVEFSAQRSNNHE